MVVERGIKGDGPSDTSVAAVGKTRPYNTFKYGAVPEEVAWAMMILLPKGRGGVSSDGNRRGGLEGLRNGG